MNNPMLMTPFDWHSEAHEDAQPLYFRPVENPDFENSGIAVVKKPKGFSFTTPNFSNELMFTCEAFLDVAERFQGKADNPLQTRAASPELTKWLDALSVWLEPKLKGREEWAPVVQRSLFGESFVRMKILDSARVYDAEGVWQRGAPPGDLAPGPHYLLCSVRPWSFNGRAGLTVRVHALQPKQEQPPAQEQPQAQEQSQTDEPAAKRPRT